LIGFAKAFSQELSSGKHCLKNNSEKGKRDKKRKTGENMN
jgi:hypothetical protein